MQGVYPRKHNLKWVKKDINERKELGENWMRVRWRVKSIGAFLVHRCRVNLPFDYTEEEIHCLTFCRARLGCCRDNFLSQLTSSTLPVLADSPELTSSAWGGTLCMCVWIFALSNRAEPIKSIGYRVGRQLLFFCIPQRAWTHHWQSKENHLTSDDAGH